MKNLVTIILMVLCVVKVNAQEFDSKLLCKKWKMDVKFGNNTLPSSNVYYIKNPMIADFFKEQNIWGITGNAYFLNKIVIIDYKNSRFGIK